MIPCPCDIYKVYDLFNAMITSFMDSKELSDSDLCAIALLHQDTAAIIGTLHKSVISTWLMVVIVVQGSVLSRLS